MGRASRQGKAHVHADCPHVRRACPQHARNAVHTGSILYPLVELPLRLRPRQSRGPLALSNRAREKRAIAGSEPLREASYNDKIRKAGGGGRDASVFLSDVLLAIAIQRNRRIQRKRPRFD